MIYGPVNSFSYCDRDSERLLASVSLCRCFVAQVEQSIFIINYKARPRRWRRRKKNSQMDWIPVMELLLSMLCGTSQWLLQSIFFSISNFSMEDDGNIFFLLLSLDIFSLCSRLTTFEMANKRYSQTANRTRVKRGKKITTDTIYRFAVHRERIPLIR